jgi:hypothetical protein
MKVFMALDALTSTDEHGQYQLQYRLVTKRKPALE